MQVASLEEFGKPLVVQDRPDPIPGPGQVVIQVEACGVCHTDLHIVRGEWEGFKSFMSLPVVPGHEVAGRVARVGPGVTRLREGDAVGVAWFHHTCGECEYCRRDLEVFCDTPAVTGVTIDGGLGEYLLAWESHAIPIPNGLSLSEAAPLFCAGGTVYSALRKVKLDPSVRLGVWGVGGLGHLAIQLAKLDGAQVTAVDLLPERLELASELGAEVVVPGGRASEWFQDPAHRLDVALVCATTVKAYQDAFRSLRRSGVLLVVGLPAQPLTWLPGDLVRSGVRIVPSRVSSRNELRELLALGAQEKICSHVHPFHLEKINEVMHLLEKGEIKGRAVIQFTPIVSPET